VTKSGAGKWVLSGANTFSGTTRSGAGTLGVGNTLALQKSTLDMNSADSGAVSFESSITAATIGGLTGSRNLTLENSNSSAVAASVGNNNASTTYSGQLSGNGSLTKVGTGTLTLTANNTYGGPTTINGGTLKANNTSGSATGTGAIVVNSGGTLAGTGAVTGAVTVNSGGTLSPGASVESLNMGALTFTGTSTLLAEIDSTYNAWNADLINANGDLSIAPTATLTLVDVGSPQNVVLGNMKFTLISYAGAWLGNTAFANAPDDSIVPLGVNQYVINYDDSTGGSNFGGGIYGDGINPHFVTLTAIPEASPMLLGALVCSVIGLAYGGRKYIAGRAA
jgi:autotransporter-associated beta strand protein